MAKGSALCVLGRFARDARNVPAARYALSASTASAAPGNDGSRGECSLGGSIHREDEYCAASRIDVFALSFPCSPLGAAIALVIILWRRLAMFVWFQTRLFTGNQTGEHVFRTATASESYYFWKGSWAARNRFVFGAAHPFVASELWKGYRALPPL
jgi:hypothetical protein